MTMKT